MSLQNFSIILLLIIFINFIFAQQSCTTKDSALIIALLALHSGDECEIIVQKGLQQIAALETTLNKINDENKIKIDLKFFDTCSNIDETVKSTLRATVFADDEECSGHRFFLGFIGPDDSDSLKAVGRISGFFKHSHVVPRAVAGYGQFNVFNVEVSQPDENAKGIGLLLQKMNWISFVVVYTSDSASKDYARSLLESNHFCVLPFILEIPSALFGQKNNSAYNKLLHMLQKVPDARVVLLADTSESIENLFNYLDGSVIGVKFLIYLQGSGVFPWKLKWALAKDCIVLQETTKSLMIPADYENYVRNTTLWSLYVNQNRNHFCKEKDEICKSFNLVVDSSILPLIYSLRLYSSALKTAHRKKCQKRGREVGSAAICNELMKMNHDEWREILENSRAFAKDEAGMNHKIGFYMVLDNVVDVFVYGGNESFNKVGSIYDGNDLSIYDSLNIFKSTGDKESQCAHLIDETTTSSTTLQPEVEIETRSDEGSVKNQDYYNLFGLWFPNDDFGYYKLVGTIIGFVSSVTVIVLLTAYFVYRNVRIKARSDGSDASVASRSP